ncbi:MAG: sel1 repeat family protein [Verrucomicrobia bacterium]|nr:sel1 repeat family protein [Verrucomicrobiota bacterium]
MAQFNLAVYLEKGTGVKQNVAEALKWYQRAAEQGNSAAQFNLGLKYSRGEGVPQDQVAAAKWFNLAAAKGHSKAQLVLGRMYSAGLGVKKDPALAEKLIRDAAAQGLEQAKLELVKLESVKTDAEPAALPIRLASSGAVAAVPVPAAEIPPFLDINRVTPAQFAGAVSFAMESMRLVYGELTPEQEKKFEAKWRPLFQFCTPKVIDYFNKLNPLLGQFLQIRSALSAVASAFDEAQQAAATAVALGSAEELMRAMDEAELARREMQTLNRALEQVVGAIVALGEPPDAEEEARRRRKAHVDALASVLRPTGRYVRVDWDAPPLPWYEDPRAYGRSYDPAQGRDRRIFLNPPGSAQDFVALALEFLASDDSGHTWAKVRCRVVHEPYIDLGGLRTDKFYRRADGSSTQLELQNKPEFFVPGSSVIEKTRFAGYDAVHFVAEYLYPSNQGERDLREGRDRYEWYAVDIGLADENVWLFVESRVNFSDSVDMPEQVPLAEARAFSEKALQRRWAKHKEICLPQQQQIMDGLRIILTDAVPQDDQKRFTLNSNQKGGPPGKWATSSSGVWRLVAGGNSRTSVTFRHEWEDLVKDKRWFTSTHSWASPPEVIPVGGDVTIALKADVSQSAPSAAYLQRFKFEKGPPPGFGWNANPYVARTMASHNFQTKDQGSGVGAGAAAGAWVFREKGPKSDSRTLRFSPVPGRGGTISIGYELTESGDTQHPLDDERARVLDAGDFGRGVEAPTYHYIWDWEPTAKVSLQAGSAVDAAQVARVSGAPVAKGERKSTAEEQEALAKLDQIEFYKAEIAVQQSDLAALQEQRSKGRPADQEGFDRRIMWAQDWIQRAQDSITTLQTGNFTRTRTAADEFNLSVMAAESSEMAAKWDTVHRLVERGPRLIALAPPEEQDKLREFFDGQVKADRLASGDLTRFKKVMATLGNRVVGSLEQAQAKSQIKLIDAEESLERLENVKTVAQTELMLLSLGGGWLRCGYAAIQGVTGYQEGGPGEAAKQVLRSFNQATIAASDAMDAYQKSVLDAYEAHAKDPRTGSVDEVRAGLGGAGWVLGKAVALEVGMKYGLEPLGRRLLNLPAPPAKKTLKELALEMQYLKRRAEGMDTVKLFQDKLAGVARASKAGATSADIDRLQREAEDVYKLIKTDWFAKMHINELGRNGNLALVRQYNVYDHYAMAQLKTAFEARQTGSGFAKQEYKLFSNSSSAGKAGMDVDLGVVEPPRFILDAVGKQIANPARRQWLDRLVTERIGGKVGLNGFREQSQKNLEAAFKDVFRYDPTKSAGREAFVNFTTSNHPEAYRDLAWLGRKGMKTADIANVDPAWVAQAASVTGFKIIDLPRHHPSFGYFATLQEQCRGTVKDFDTKLAPMLARATNKTAVKHMQELRGVMDKFAKNEIGPVEANRLILEMTGGKGMCEVKDQYAVMLEALTKGR